MAVCFLWVFLFRARDCNEMLVQKSKPNCSHCDTWYQLVTHGTHVTSWYQVSQWTVYSFVTAFHVCDSILVLTRRLNTGYGVVIPGLLNRLRLWRAGKEYTTMKCVEYSLPTVTLLQMKLFLTVGQRVPVMTQNVWLVLPAQHPSRIFHL